MNNLLSLKNLEEIKINGITKVQNFLSSEELEKIKNIISFYSAPKGHKNSYWPTNLRLLLYKVIKLNFKKLSESLYFLDLVKKKKLNEFSNKFFKEKSYLGYIDAYCSEISDKEILPWHTDQAYGDDTGPYKGGEKLSDGYVNPDHFFLKFFIYLTDVGPDDGVMNYITESHKIGYAIRKGVFEGKIPYQRYSNLKDFRKLVFKKENENYFQNYFKDKGLIDRFLSKTEFINKDVNEHKFNYKMNAGDAIIFNEGGVHRGSKTLYNKRMILRYMYSIK